MFLPALGAAIAVAQPSETAQFEVVGVGLVSEEATSATWRQVPTAETLPDASWEQLPYQALLRAKCMPQSDGTLKDCRIFETLPATLKNDAFGPRLFDQLKLSLESASAFRGESLYVYIQLTNPVGTGKNTLICESPFCIPTPPPPPVGPFRPSESEYKR